MLLPCLFSWFGGRAVVCTRVSSLMPSTSAAALRLGVDVARTDDLAAALLDATVFDVGGSAEVSAAPGCDVGEAD